MSEVTEKLLKEIRLNKLVNQADPIDVGILTFQDEIRAMCEQNTCGRYGKSWNCPPACGTVQELEAVCKHFSKGILINTITQLEDSFDWEGMQQGGRNLNDLMLFVNRLAKELGVEDYRVFSGGACKSCEECAYPDVPCRFPDQQFTPIEACGINVSQAAIKSGFKYINGPNTVTNFGMILYN
ncbi:MAG: DUF2284 domain-containing protein [Clostridiales Family XIII bacterium]|jgi:predicted metal-binding protein|nr:DUF2284 domain-containing protein [Clostridiales Family XIII bacterium]